MSSAVKGHLTKSNHYRFLQDTNSPTEPLYASLGGHTNLLATNLIRKARSRFSKRKLVDRARVLWGPYHDHSSTPETHSVILHLSPSHLPKYRQHPELTLKHWLSRLDSCGKPKSLALSKQGIIPTLLNGGRILFRRQTFIVHHISMII